MEGYFPFVFRDSSFVSCVLLKFAERSGAARMHRGRPEWLRDPGPTLIYLYDNSYHNFVTPSLPPLKIVSSFYDPKEIREIVMEMFSLITNIPVD